MTGAMVRLSAWSTGSWYGEQRAGAVSEQDYTQEVYWRTRWDGKWTRRCPEPHCDWCVRGRAKRAWNRKQRRDAKDWARVERDLSDEEIAEIVRFLNDEGPSVPVSTTPGFVSQYIDDPVARRQRAEEYMSRLNTHYWVGYDGKLHQTVRSSV